MAVLFCWVHNVFHIYFYMYREEVCFNLSVWRLQNVPVPVRVGGMHWLVCLLSSKLCVHLREVGWERECV